MFAGASRASRTRIALLWINLWMQRRVCRLSLSLWHHLTTLGLGCRTTWSGISGTAHAGRGRAQTP